MKAFNFSSPNKLLLLLSIAVLSVSYNMAFANKQTKFSVDLSLLISQNQFKVYEHKSFANSAIAANLGYEIYLDETTAGNRLLDVENTPLNLPTKPFSLNNTDPSVIDMAVIDDKINVLKVHGLPWTTPAFSNFKYSFKTLTTEEFQALKPSDALPFDVGFLAADGTINVSPPTTDEQKAIFKDITKAAVYYLCQSYMYYFYQTQGLPLIFKVGFGAYEAGLNLTDTDIKTAINNYGGSFPSFDILNNSSTFVSNRGIMVAHAFAEFMSAYKNWGYPMVINVNATGFDAASWWFNTGSLKELLDDFNRYLAARFLEPDESLRIKVVLETENFRFYTRPVDAAVNFPMLSEAIEKAYQEYFTNYNVKAYDKLTCFTLADCADAVIDGISCDPATVNIGGTAWSSGFHFGCSSKPERINDVIHLARHELAHAFQGFMPIGEGTQWLGEGFAFFSDAGPFNADFSNMNMGSGFWKQMLISSLERGTTFFGHRPTYEDTKVYPGYETDYGYKYLGWYLNDFIYRKGGYTAVKDVQLGDLAGYKKMGYSSGQAIMDAFYFDFDVRLQNKKVATLISPVPNVEETASSVNISWTPLSASVELIVSVSTDNGANWTTIATNTTATSCDYNIGNYRGEFLIRFSAPEVFNLQTMYGPFYKIDLAKPLINFPNGTEYLIVGDTVNISWSKTNIPNYKIEFSGDNGSNWSTINTSAVASTQSYKWIVPSTISNQCKIRISDAANSTNNDLNDANFTILSANQIGGPYLSDENTVALLHFDIDLNNRSTLSGNGIGEATNLANDATHSPFLGNCYKTSSPISIPHNANLSLTGDWTIEAWVKINSFSTTQSMYLLTKPGDSNPYDANYSLEINPWWSNVFHGFYFSGANSRIGSTTYAPILNEWYHVAFIRDTKKSEIRIIVHDKNRKKVSSNFTRYTKTETLLNTRDLIIGQDLDGYIDELRISNVVRNFDYPIAPYSPNPENSATKVLLTKLLSWTNGLNTGSVDLYLDTTNPPLKKVLENAVSTSSFSPALLSNTTYFWQVVAKNELLSAPGPIWSFTTDYATGLDSWSTNDLQIYPNPSGGIFQLKNRPDQDQIEMRIIDLNGKTVFKEIIPPMESPKFDLSHFPKGIYFVHFVREKETKTTKMIFQ